MMQEKKNPWLWVPTLFFTDAVPYVILTLLCVLYYKRTGISHMEITCMENLILLPWLLKPIVLESRLLKSHPRFFALCGQIFIIFGLLGLSFTAGSWYKSTSLLLFLPISLGYVLHTTSAQVLYEELGSMQRKVMQGIRNASYRIGTLMGAGIMVMFVGGMETLNRRITNSWSLLFLILAGCFTLSIVYHALLLPAPEQKELPLENVAERLKIKRDSLLTIFQRMTEQEGANTALLFILFYPLPQALLSSIIPLFLLDPISRGGAALSTQELGLCYGTIGLIALSAGAILGMKAIKKDGLTSCLPLMTLCMSIPCWGYLFIHTLQIENFGLVSLFVFLERFCFGYGFTAYVNFVRFFCARKKQYYTWCSIYMTLGFILPGLISGYLQQTLGYSVFFVLVMTTGILPAIATTRIIKKILNK